MVLRAAVLLVLLSQGQVDEVRSAVDKGLVRIGKLQRSNGSWDPPRETIGGLRINEVGSTGLVLFGCGCAGYGPATIGAVQDFLPSESLKKAFIAVSGMQGSDGCLVMKEGDYGANQIFGTLGLVHAWIAAPNDEFKGPAVKAAEYLRSLQQSDGGWWPAPEKGTDALMTVWACLALEAAVAGKLVEPTHREKARAFLESCTLSSGVALTPNGRKPGEKALSAGVLFLRLRWGAPLEGPAAKLADQVKGARATWDTGDFFGWVLLAAAAREHREGGELLQKLTASLRSMLLKNAEKDGTWLQKRWGADLRPVSTALAAAALAAVADWKTAPGGSVDR